MATLEKTTFWIKPWPITKAHRHIISILKKCYKWHHMQSKDCLPWRRFVFHTTDIITREIHLPATLSWECMIFVKSRNNCVCFKRLAWIRNLWENDWNEIWSSQIWVCIYMSGKQKDTKGHWRFMSGCKGSKPLEPDMNLHILMSIVGHCKCWCQINNPNLGAHKKTNGMQYRI